MTTNTVMAIDDSSRSHYLSKHERTPLSRFSFPQLSERLEEVHTADTVGFVQDDTGTSKEWIAQAIQDRSPRIIKKTGPDIELYQLLESSGSDGRLTDFEGIIGSSLALREILDQVLTVGPTASTVLIEGETGTGKELIARAIHIQSERRTRPFVTLNCAAIPAELLESELFGHERGAFTGAVIQRIGRFEAANGGTLFLDEIGDMPLGLQSKLLRVLQEQAFERLGSTHTRRVDVRVIAATNQDLDAMVAEKEFRMDLYYRLNVFPIALPPLRLRSGDIPLLVAHFVRKFCQRMSKQISKVPRDAMEALVRYRWPGNIRELQNIIERAVILTSGDVLQIPSLPSFKATRSEPTTLAAAERDHILRTLRECRCVVGGPNGAAVRLGLKRTTLLAKMTKLGISARDGRERMSAELVPTELA